MSWDLATAQSNLRTLISDGPTDKFGYRKEVLGTVDGVNVTYKTIDSRRLTDFVTATAPEGVYVNGTLVAASSDDLVVGEFVLSSAPAINSKVRASYYFQWFLDSEITDFLTSGVAWCLSVTDVAAVADGLRPAVLHFAAAEAYQKLAIRWARRLSEEFRTEDAQDEERYKIIDAYKKSADSERKIAQTFRENFYKRNDQALSPLYTTVSGAIRRVQPRR